MKRLNRWWRHYDLTKGATVENAGQLVKSDKSVNYMTV